MNNKLIIVALLNCLGMLQFGPIAIAQPAATTLAATSIGQTNATLHGTVNPNGAAAVAYYQYGLTTNYDDIGSFVALPATNATLTLPGLVVNAAHGAAGASWTQTSAPVTNWSSIASSADGTRLAAVVNGAGIYTSTNAGVTWTQTSAPNTGWNSIASSADGTRLASVDFAHIFTSTNSGVTWTQTSAPLLHWNSIASSADGTRLAAGANNGGIYTSTNGGVTWTQTSALLLNWTSIASSADGTRLAAAQLGFGGGGTIHTSMDGGGTWTQTSAPPYVWSFVTSSADGTRLAALAGEGVIYTSTNAGATWTQTSAPATNWSSMATSADGSRLTAVAFGGGVYTSTNGGVTWTPGSAPNASWQSIASSADGWKLAAAGNNGVFTSSGPAISLSPGTTYHYRAVGLNTAGTGAGNDLTFITSAGAPSAATVPASGISATNATLKGTVTTGNLTTSAYFRYGLTTNYGSFSATNTLAATNVTLSMNNLVSSLTPATNYHFQMVASNSAGVAAGGDLTFTTRHLPPVATTLPATSVTPTNATLNATVNPNGAAAAAYFQYGPTTNYGCLGGLISLPATNTTITLPGLGVNALYEPAGASWTQSSAPATNWSSIASSADGSRLAAVVGRGASGGIYISTNAGATWTQTSAPITNWSSIASSADGKRLAASAIRNIFTSTNGGVTWTQASVPQIAWQSIASSVDGMNLAAVVNGGGIYTSTNGGLTWTQTSAPNQNWSSIASSADGARLAAVDLGLGVGGGIYTSIDGGAAWTQTSAPEEYWNSIASSADGLRLAAVHEDFHPWTSTDGGVTWAPANNSPNGYWNSIASSADGSRLTAAILNGGIYTSTNGGGTWAQGSASNAAWYGIASSADGSKLAAAGGGGIFTSTGTASQLTPGATYHYRVVGLNFEGTSLGNDLTFTIPGAPTATTLAATAITSINATLNGTVNPNGPATSAYFRYGLTTNYGSYSPTNTLAATNVALSVSNLVGSLTPGTTYHFRLVAGNSVGTNVGNDLSFVTLALPAVTTLPAAGITSTNATLNGSVNPNGSATSAYFRYGLTTNYGSYSPTNTLAATNVALSVSNLVGSLTAGTTYHFQLVAANSVGTNAGADLTFTTGPAVPVVTTLAATGITSTNATLNGTVNPNGAGTIAYFRYGLTTNYGSYSPTNALAGTNVTLSVSNLVGSLTPGTTYHFQLVAGNSAGTYAGADLTFTTGPTVPVVTTLAATGVTSTNASLNGTVNPNGAATSAYFRYGLTTNYGNFSSTNSLVATNVALSVSNLVGGLTPGTTYHFRLVAGNSVGTNVGGDLTFTTQPGPPIVTSLPAASITSTNATLNGTVNPNGAATSAYFRYGLTTNYGNYSATNSLVATNVALSVSSLVGSLAPGTTYHFQLVAGNSVGTNAGADLTFTAGQTVPVVTTLAATSITATNATLNGSVNPNGTAASAYFRYGLTTNYGNFSSTNSLLATNVTLSVSNLVGGLTPGTIYHFQLVAGNSSGTNAGADLTFTTGPVVTTLAATGVTSTNASLNGTVNPNGAATSAYFRYGLTTNYGNFSGTNTLAATNVTLSVSNLVGGLTPGTTYHFQLVAGNSVGTNVGADLTFTAGSATPVVTTLAATGVTSTNATLNGAVNPNGAATSAYFRYGLTTNYGNFSATNTLAATNVTLSVSNLVGNLTQGTNYHFQLVAGNSVGTNVGGDLTFTTPLGPPIVTSLSAASITSTNATLNGTVNPNGNATSAYFRYGLTTNYGSYSPTNALAATNATLSVSNLVGNLTQGTTYHFQLVAANSAGVAVGGDLTFTTRPLPPVATTLAATSVGQTNATLNGTVNPNGDITMAYFQYGLTTNYSSLGGATLLPATNITQTLPGLVVSSLRAAAGENWVATGATNTTWQSIASSADGSQLAAVVYGGGIYTSTNSGSSWTPTGAPSTNWQYIVSSADGTRLAAVVDGGGIYTTTNQGSTWIQTSAPVKSWTSIASSADGARLMAVLGGFTFYSSTNSGLTWTPVTVTDFGHFWSCIACSADGLRLAASSTDGYTYVSTDGGLTWTRSFTPGITWTSIASSADGARLVMVANPTGIYASTDGGSTWRTASSAIHNWKSIASSADGTRLAAVYNDSVTNGGIYTSTDSGVTWTPSSAPSASWYSIASSADGTRLAAIVNGGGIYTSTGPTNSLAPGTTYHYRLVGYNSVGASFGSDLTFTIPGSPAAVTLSATSISSTNATLNGSVNPNGVTTSAYFRYGLTTNYGSYSATNALGATNVALSVSSLIGSLTPGAIYHFQVVAGNSLGTNVGNNLTFVTLAQPATTSLAATGTTSTSATLNGTVNPNGAATSAYFRYGSTTNYGSYSATNALAATNVALAVSSLVSSLTPGTTYHFQLVAGNSVGTNAGGDLSLTTQPGAPSVTSFAATGITSTNASLNGNVNPNGAATSAYFRYGLTTNYGSYSATNALAATNVALSVSSLVSSLTPGTTYHFQLVAGNSAGTNAGADLLFTTTSAQAVGFSLTGSTRLPGGAFQFSFTNLSGLGFTVLATTNLALPLTNWTVLGAPIEAPPGHYQFTDQQATNSSARHYRVRSQ